MSSRRRLITGLTVLGITLMPGVAAADAPSPARVTAATEVFGADLSKPVNSDRTCWGGLVGIDAYREMAATQGLTLEQMLWILQNVYGQNFEYPGCTWWNVGRFPNPGETATNLGDNVVPYGGGTLQSVRIKTGPVVGRMQVVVLRFIRHPGSTANPGGPFFVAASQEFTPQANTINEIPMNIPVKHELDKASGVWNYDVIALSVLEPNVPMPFWSGGDPSVAGGILARYPAWVPGVEQYQDVGSLDQGGSVLMQGVLAQAAPAPQVTLPTGTKPSVNRAGTKALVPLLCGPGSACEGLLQLQNRKAVAAAKTTTFGKARFSLEASEKGQVSVRLSKTARKQLKAGKTLKAWANVTMGSSHTSLKVTLRKS